MPKEITEAMEVIAANPSNHYTLLIMIFIVAVVIFGIPAIISRSLTKVLVTLFIVIFAFGGTYLMLF